MTNLASRLSAKAGARLIIPPLILLGGCANPSTDFMSPTNPFSFNREKGHSLRSHFISDMKAVSDLEADYYAGTAADRRQTDRDKIATYLINDFNLCWYNFSSAFQGRYGLVTSISESTAAGLAAFSAVLPYQQTARFLSAGAASILGSEAAIQKDFFQGNAAYIIIGQMDADRQQILSAIRTSLAKPDSDYPLNQLLIDLWNYVNVMTVPHALTALNGKVGQQASQNQNGTYGQKQPPVTMVGVSSKFSLAAGADHYEFTASGGAGSGAYEWTCTLNPAPGAPASKGTTYTGLQANVAFPSAGTYTLTLIRDGDSSYQASDPFTIAVTRP